LMEMAFAGNCSIDVCVPNPGKYRDFEVLFNEEGGFVVEVSNDAIASVESAYKDVGVQAVQIGTVFSGDYIKIAVGPEPACIEDKMTSLRDIWEATSFQLEKRQRNPECVLQEEQGLKLRQAPKWQLTFNPSPTDRAILSENDKPKVAVLREEGSNGDREMLAAFICAGFDAWDVTVSDLLEGNISLEDFRGIALVGGFSFADVLDSGKGWAGVIKFNKTVYDQFSRFRSRKDTFSLGVCNGCQLMALLGWIPSTDGLPADKQPRLLHNHSGKFESRFSSVQIQKSPAIMFKVSRFGAVSVYSNVLVSNLTQTLLCAGYGGFLTWCVDCSR